MAACPWRIIAITDRRQMTPSVSAAATAALDGGIRALLLREKDLPDKQLQALATKLRQITWRYGAQLILHGSPQTARDCNADGLHLSQQQLSSLPQMRHGLGAASWLGASCHTWEQAQQAQAAGADYILYSPIFPSLSKPGYKPSGSQEDSLRQLQDICSRLTLPVFALGGITPQNAPPLLACGAHGIAVMGGLWQSGTPVTAQAQAYKQYF